MAATAIGCGSSDPENVIELHGTVVAASDGQGYTAGQAIDGAQMTLRYTAPLDLTVETRDSDQSDSSGAWTLMSGPPRGQTDPDCRTLTVLAVRVGFETARLPLSSTCGIGADVVSGVVIEMTPVPPK